MQLNKLKGKYSPHYACKVLFLTCSFAKKKVVKQSLKNSLKEAKKKSKTGTYKNSSFSFDAFIVFIYLSGVSKLKLTEGKILSNKITNIDY